MYVVNVAFIQPTNSCFGPEITADINKTAINISETVTVTGHAGPPSDNLTVRVAFTRPNYSYIEQIVKADPETGNFSATQSLDMAGVWNVFAINGALCDRLFVQVTDPLNPDATTPPPPVPLTLNPNYYVYSAAAALSGIGIAAVAYGYRKRTIKISSIRMMVQIGLLFLIFFGIFSDHQYTTFPAGELKIHSDLVTTNFLGVSMPNGIPAPLLACYYPCGGTVTCALWQIQVYLYPFFNTGGGWGVHYDTTGLERLAVVFGIIIVAAVLLGRVFCGWACPFGLYLDFMTRIRKALKVRMRRFSDRFNTQLHQLSYVLLASIIIISVLFGSQAIAGTQIVPGTEKGGFVYTYFSAPFCQVCPMKPFCMIAWTGLGLLKPDWVTQTTTGQFYELGLYLTSPNLIIFGLVTVAAFFFRRSWCRICPLGGLIALFNRFKPFKWISGVRLNKVEEKCKKCGTCKRVCPTQSKTVYQQKSGDVADSQCIWCLRCVEMCPYDDCLQFKFAGKTVFKSRNWLNNSGDFKVDG